MDNNQNLTFEQLVSQDELNKYKRATLKNVSLLTTVAVLRAKDKSGTIVGYKLLELRVGNSIDVNADELKGYMLNGWMEVANLTRTSDNRIVTKGLYDKDEDIKLTKGDLFKTLQDKLIDQIKPTEWKMIHNFIINKAIHNLKEENEGKETELKLLDTYKPAGKTEEMINGIINNNRFKYFKLKQLTDKLIEEKEEIIRGYLIEVIDSIKERYVTFLTNKYNKFKWITYYGEYLDMNIRESINDMDKLESYRNVEKHVDRDINMYIFRNAGNSAAAGFIYHIKDKYEVKEKLILTPAEREFYEKYYGTLDRYISGHTLTSLVIKKYPDVIHTYNNMYKVTNEENMLTLLIKLLAREDGMRTINQEINEFIKRIETYYGRKLAEVEINTVLGEQPHTEITEEQREELHGLIYRQKQTGEIVNLTDIRNWIADMK